VTWWQNPELRELPDALRRYVEYEAVAVAIHSFYIRYIPGPLQLPAYARALTGSLDGDIPESRIGPVIEARRIRREAMLPRLGHSLRYHVLVEEQVFLRTTGGSELFREQLKELMRLSDENLIHIRMLPFSLEVPIANNASYDLLSLGGSGSGNEVLYRENGVTDELIEDDRITTRHLNRFNYLWDIATHERDTYLYMEKRVQALATDSSA
jgi:hypothetical protein